MTTASTHVLDAARGLPAVGLSVTLETTSSSLDGVQERPGGGLERSPGRPASGTVVAEATTDADGRIAWGEVPGPGAYVLTFATGEWFAAQGRETFFGRVVLDVTLGADHTHVALLLSPFAYTTYRGS